MGVSFQILCLSLWVTCVFADFHQHDVRGENQQTHKKLGESTKQHVLFNSNTPKRSNQAFLVSQIRSIRCSPFVKKNINICVDGVDTNIRVGIAKSFPGVFPDALLSFSLSDDIYNIDYIQLPNLLQYIINIHHIWLLLSCWPNRFENQMYNSSVCKHIRATKIDLCNQYVFWAPKDKHSYINKHYILWVERCPIGLRRI